MKYSVAFFLILFVALTVRADSNAQRIFELVNASRVSHNVPPLRWSSLLATAAENKAAAIFTSQQFKHTINGKRFSQFVQDVGYEQTAVGENLGITITDPEALVAEWINSPSHAENIFRTEFTETGVATKTGVMNGIETTVTVQIFATPKELFQLKNADLFRIGVVITGLGFYMISRKMTSASAMR